MDWLRSVLHQVQGKAGMVLQAHLIEGQSLKGLAQALNCSRSSLRFISMRGWDSYGNEPTAMVLCQFIPAD